MKEGAGWTRGWQDKLFRPLLFQGAHFTLTPGRYSVWGGSSRILEVVILVLVLLILLLFLLLLVLDLWVQLVLPTILVHSIMASLLPGVAQAIILRVWAALDFSRGMPLPQESRTILLLLEEEAASSLVLPLLVHFRPLQGAEDHCPARYHEHSIKGSKCTAKYQHTQASHKGAEDKRSNKEVDVMVPKILFLGEDTTMSQTAGVILFLAKFARPSRQEAHHHPKVVASSHLFLHLYQQHKQIILLLAIVS